MQERTRATDVLWCRQLHSQIDNDGDEDKVKKGDCVAASHYDCRRRDGSLREGKEDGKKNKGGRESGDDGICQYMFGKRVSGAGSVIHARGFEEAIWQPGSCWMANSPARHWRLLSSVVKITGESLASAQRTRLGIAMC
jgi:hypothetical protein